jgi:hypothetical protein
MIIRFSITYNHYGESQLLDLLQKEKANPANNQKIIV